MSATTDQQKSNANRSLNSTKAMRVDYHKNVILLIGNPNVGKTSIFNQLARKYAITANYPFTTVDLNIDAIKLSGKEFELIDGAGIYRLDHPSEEGQLTRDVIFNYHPEILLQVIEAAKLESSLLLTAQLIELDIPLVIILNMIDETAKQRIRIQTRVLSELLGVPVIETIAIEGKGIDAIKKAITTLGSRPHRPSYPQLVQQFYQEISSLFPAKHKPPRAIMMLLALEDPFALKWIEENYGAELATKVKAQHARFLDQHMVNLSIIILNAQHLWIQNIIQRTVSHKKQLTQFGIQKFGEISRHPLYGWLIVALAIALIYFIVGKFGAVFLVDILDYYLFAPLVSWLETVIPSGIIARFFIGNYGILTTGLFNAIGTVLPIITLFFLLLNLLEDVGYLTNLVILTNRLFKKFGLSGKSILPIVLGFGCKTMATLSTRILDSKKEKYIAIFLIGLAIPCSSQMSVNIAVLATQPIFAFIILMLVLLFVEIFAGLVLNRIVPEQQPQDFLLEIPPIRLPDLRQLLRKTYYRTSWFVKEAVPLFMFGALILFVLHETGGINLLEWGLRPVVVNWLNLPIQFSEALVMSLARSEAGAVLILNMVQRGELTTIQIIVAVIVITLFVPCISNVMAMIKELRWKPALFMVMIITIAAFVIGGMVNLVLRW
ncbi:MAG: ferrous iron transport protein B [candidate division KSB1 bacterium]|nr:ferrous iron transport protein B [candidate division KSB1 bacterium]